MIRLSSILQDMKVSNQISPSFLAAAYGFTERCASFPTGKPARLALAKDLTSGMMIQVRNIMRISAGLHRGLASSGIPKITLLVNTGRSHLDAIAADELTADDSWSLASNLVETGLSGHQGKLEGY